MAHANTIFSQLLKLLPRHEFQKLARCHHVGQRLRKVSRWDQFTALTMAQLSGRQSLRDIEANLKIQRASQYHLGCRPIAKSSLARLNEKQPYTLYEALFCQILQRSKGLASRHKFRFKNPLFSLDASIIDLSLKIFPWSDFNRKRGAVKLHVGLDHSGHLPAFVNITGAHCYDVHGAENFDFPAGSIVVMDKGYTDYGWYKQLTDKDIFFVTRLRNNALYRVIERRRSAANQNITCDQTIKLTGKRAVREATPALRRIGYRDSDTGKHYIFLTNNFALSATTIAAIYKDRWQVELFFKALKQNLKIHAFVGTSKNAVLTQIWIAMCTYLLLAYVKFISKTSWSVQGIMRVLQINLFAKLDLMSLVRPLQPPDQSSPPQLRLLA